MTQPNRVEVEVEFFTTPDPDEKELVYSYIRANECFAVIEPRPHGVTAFGFKPEGHVKRLKESIARDKQTA